MYPHSPSFRPSFFQLCCEEPYRVFFPLGALIGISGVSLWPLYFSGLHKFYPGLMHARLMIEGFVTCFALGFVGTVAPRLTGTPHLSRSELFSLLALLIGVAGIHIAERSVIGDFVYLALLLVFAARMSWRFSWRPELPPATLALVAFGFLNAVFGVMLLLAAGTGEGCPRCGWLGLLLLNQGFPLDLVFGVGGYFLPRFLAIPATPEPLDASEISARWRRRAHFASVIGATLFLSYVVDAFAELPRTACMIRLLAAAVFLAVELPLSRFVAYPVAISRGPRFALLFLSLGLFVPVLWPWRRLAGEHLIFIGGFTLIAFIVATRVVFGLSDHGQPLAPPLPFLRRAITLLAMAAVLRVAGDFLPFMRGAVLSAASYLWMLAAAIWSWRVLPKVRNIRNAPRVPASVG